MKKKPQEEITQPVIDPESLTLGDLPHHHSLQSPDATPDPFFDATSLRPIDLPKNLGRYRDLRKIAEGGMSVVYQAFDSRYKRKVALKFLRATQTATLKRFLREAASQAKVHHDNVLEVYEIGKAQGHPFIALRLVEGPSLLTWSRDASVAERVKIAYLAALALDAAHQAGLIHRDVKPSNILLQAEEDRTVTPLLTDFGIALDPSDPLLTATLQVVGTPHYMAPEQLKMRSSLLDGRVDVYALGVTLYRMLSGRLPFPGLSTAEVMTAILQDDAPPLRKIRPGLPADIEAVVSRCMEKDRSQRYPSMLSLADDLERFLQGQAVKARHITFGDRVRKWIQKNPQTFLVASAGALIVMTALTGWGITASIQAGQIQEEANRARSEAHSAQNTLDFFEHLFTRTEPERLRNDTLSAAEILNRGVDQVQELEEQSDSQGRLLMSLGRVNYHLGRYGEAIEAFRGARDAWQTISPTPSERLIKTLSWLGNTQVTQGEYSFGIETLEKRLALSREFYGTSHGETAIALVELGDAVGHLRDPIQADYLEEAMAIQQHAFPSDHPDRALILRAYGSWLRFVPKGNKRATLHLEEALRIQRKSYGTHHRETYDTLFILATHYGGVDRFEEAEVAFKELLSIGESFLGEDHPKHGAALWNYSILLQDLDLLEEAAHYIRQSAAIEETLPGRPMHKAITLSGIGEVLHRQGKLQEAEDHHRRALAILEMIEGSERAFERGYFACELAEVLQDGNRFEEALAWYETGLEAFGDFGGFVEEARDRCQAKREKILERISN